MFKKVFLISGLSPFISEQVSPQIGLGYLSEVLRSEGIESFCYDYSYKRSIKDLAGKIRGFGPDLIGVHMMSHGYLKQFEILKKLKTIAPDTKIIVGGPHASIYRKSILEENSHVDFVSYLEGEETLRDLAKGTEHPRIRGLIYRGSACIIENEQRPFIEPLDTLGFPTYGSFDLKSYPSKIISIITSRGCPYECIYCPVQSAIGCRYRTRSPQNVFEEILYWYKKGRREIWVQDDNFTLVPKRVDSLLELILSRNLKGLRIALPNGIRSDKVSQDLLIKMKKAGFFHIAFGVEAGNDRTLEKLKKNERTEDVRRAIEWSLKAGIRVSLFFLVGSPYETEEDVQDSFEIARKYDVAQAAFYNLIPFPKTELYDWARKKNYLLYEPEHYLNSIDHYSLEPVFETPELGREQRKRLLLKAKGVSQEIRNRHIKSLLPGFLRFIPPSFYFFLTFLYKLRRRFS